jgi:uncharacterized protein YodC (DUF2158 family)
VRSEEIEEGKFNGKAGLRFGRKPLVNAQEPEPGDEVVLRTGGPVMTVLGSADDDRPRELFCVWFDEQRRRCQGTFHSELLMLVEYAT